MTSRVRFEANEPYRVQWRNLSCDTPCELELPRGPQTVRLLGDDDWESEVDVGYGPQLAKINHRHKGGDIAGSVICIVLGTGLTAASYFVLSGGGRSNEYAYVSIILGPVAVIIGIVFLIKAAVSRSSVEVEPMTSASVLQQYLGVPLAFDVAVDPRGQGAFVLSGQF